MAKHVVIVAVVLSAVFFVFMAPGMAEAQNENTGSIKGKLRGFHNVEHVIVYIEKMPGEYPPPSEPIELDQVKLEFVPHVLPIVKGTTVRFHNSDPIEHDITWPTCCNGAYPSHSLGTWGQGASRDFTFHKEAMITLLCKIHPRMEAHIAVLQNPFFVMGSKKGDYEIKNIPGGEYVLRAWSPKPRKRKPVAVNVTVTAGSVTVQNLTQ